MFKNLGKTRTFNNQLRYISRPAVIEESMCPPLLLVTVMIISLALVILLLWSSLATIRQVTIASGEVVPSRQIQVIQHLEGGIISNIHVTEGESITQGQLLVTLDGVDFKQDLKRLIRRQDSLALQAERLQALIENRLPRFNMVAYGREYDALKKEQMQIFESMIEAYDAEKQVLTSQIQQQTTNISRLEGKLKSLKKNLSLTEEELAMKQTLLDKGMTSKVSFIKLQQHVNALQSRVDENVSDITQAHEAIEELKSRLVALDTGYRQTHYARLETIRSQISLNEESIAKLEDKVARLEIVSPVNGIVRRLQVNTVGGVVASGQPIMDIVPMGGNLIVESYIKPSDIANVVIGQETDVKISSFDFSRYGSVRGRLEYLSASTVEHPDGGKYYVARVSLNQSYVGSNAQKNKIVPGMTVQTFIITGKKTILSYMLKPVKASLAQVI